MDITKMRYPIKPRERRYKIAMDFNLFLKLLPKT